MDVSDAFPTGNSKLHAKDAPTSTLASVSEQIDRQTTANGAPAVKVIGKMGLVMRAFLSGNPELQLQQIAECTGLDLSTASRIAASLASTGLLRYDAVQRVYSPGPMILELGYAIVTRFGFRELLHREIVAFTNEHGWACVLGTADEGESDQVVYAYVSSPGNSPHHVRQLSLRRPAVRTSSGLVMIAYGTIPLSRIPEADQPADLESQLYTVIEQGYAVYLADQRAGVAAPLWNSANALIGTLGIDIPRETFDASPEFIVAAVVERARSLSAAAALSGVHSIPSDRASLG